MGALGSKEKLGQIVVIYGYNLNDFCWKDTISRSNYHTTGLIINLAGKKYVITARSRLISCKNIVMYHSYFSDENPILMNNLHILFQSIEYNLIIMGTKEKDELDLSESELINGELEGNIISENGVVPLKNFFEICPSYNLDLCTPIVPNKKSKYYTIRIDTNFDSSVKDYQVHIYSAKFVKPIIHDETYLPDNYMYNFKLLGNEKKMVGICGAIIFNDKHQLIGIISQLKSKSLYVLPNKVLLKFCYDFLVYKNKPNHYNGLLTLPLNLKISKNILPKIDRETEINTINGKQYLKNNDLLVSINKNDIIANENDIVVYDNDYKNHIPLSIYLVLTLKESEAVQLIIMRKKKIIEYMLIPEAINNYIFPISNTNYFYPEITIPFIKIADCIIVELTHELLDITMINKITLSNNEINNFLATGSITNNRNLLIIDCLDKTTIKKYDLPQLIIGKKKTIKCPLVTMINGKDVSSIKEINELIILPKGKNILKIGLSYQNQTNIYL